MAELGHHEVALAPLRPCACDGDVHSSVVSLRPTRLVLKPLSRRRLHPGSAPPVWTAPQVKLLPQGPGGYLAPSRRHWLAD